MSEKIIVYIDPDLEGLVPGFLNNRGKDVESIRDFLDKENFDAIRVLGHCMKGAGGGYGFDAITEIGDEIENAALGRDAAVIGEANARLADYLARVEPIYKS